MLCCDAVPLCVMLLRLAGVLLFDALAVLVLHLWSHLTPVYTRRGAHAVCCVPVCLFAVCHLCCAVRCVLCGQVHGIENPPLQQGYLFVWRKAD